MIHDVVGIVLVRLHFQVSVHQGFARADFDVDLVSFLPLEVSICDKYFLLGHLCGHGRAAGLHQGSERQGNRTFHRCRNK
jgi:hypothetical protein